MKSLEILAGECEELSATLTAAVERGEALPEPELHALLGRARMLHASMRAQMAAASQNVFHRDVFHPGAITPERSKAS
jgi:hypothetical protein